MNKNSTRATLLGSTLLKVANAGPDEIVELPPEFPWSLIDHMDADEIRDWFEADR